MYGYAFAFFSVNDKNISVFMYVSKCVYMCAHPSKCVYVSPNVCMSIYP